MNADWLNPRAVRRLICDRTVVRAFKRSLGSQASRCLRALFVGDHDDLPDTDPDAKTLLMDVVANDARLYTRFRAVGREDDHYHIDVRGLGGLYLVDAAEHGRSKIFWSQTEAEAWVTKNWNDSLVSWRGRRYRPPFSKDGRDAAPPPRLKARESAELKARRKERDRKEREQTEQLEKALVPVCVLYVWDDVLPTRYECFLDIGVTPIAECRLWINTRDVPTPTKAWKPGDVDVKTAARILLGQYFKGTSSRELTGWEPGEVLNQADLDAMKQLPPHEWGHMAGGQ